MKKWLIFFSAFTLLVLVSFTSYLWFNRTAFVSQTLERLYGVPCSIKSISWSKRGLYLYDVRLLSPIESNKTPLFSCAKIELKLPLIEQIALATGFRPVFVDRICLSKPVFDLEAYSKALARRHTQSCSRRFFVKKVELEKCGVVTVDTQGRHKIRRPESLEYIRLQGIDRTKALCLSELLLLIGADSINQVEGRLNSSVDDASLPNE